MVVDQSVIDQLTTLCNKNKWTLVVFNHNHHVRISSGPVDMMGDYVQWWPASGRFVKHDRWNTATFHHSIEGMIEATENYFRWHR